MGREIAQSIYGEGSMKDRNLTQHQQSQNDTHPSKGWLQRRALRSLPSNENEVKPSFVEESGLNQSYVSVPVLSHGLPPIQRSPFPQQFSQHPASEVSRPNQTGLPDRLKTGIENLSGYSMDDVRVHYNSNKPARLKAHAYTQGTDIHIAPGQEKHLPHEAWHVVQQKQGRVKPTMQMKTGVKVNDDKGLEKEADVMGAKASATTEASNETQQLKSTNDTNVVQCLPKPGVGIELESSTIKLVSEKRESDNTDLLGGHKLKGQSIYPNEKIAMFEETNMWSLTAESTGYNPEADSRQLAVEIIVHGGGLRKGVKLTKENKGILTKVAENLMRHTTYWQDYWTVTGLLGERHWNIVGHHNIMDSDWGLQVTSAVPLDTMHDLLTKYDENTSVILPKKQATRMVSVSSDVFEEDKGFPDAVYRNKQFLGLMSLICSYANGAKSMTKSSSGVKHMTPIMPRTDFVGMINSLPEEVKNLLMSDDGALFMKMARAAVQNFGVQKNATFYWEGVVSDAPPYKDWLADSEYVGRPEKIQKIVAPSAYMAENAIKLTVFDWIDHLAKGEDHMAKLDLSNRHGQIGGIGQTVEHTLDSDDRKAPVFEFRDIGSTKLSNVAKTFAEIEREVRKILGET